MQDLEMLQKCIEMIEQWVNESKEVMKCADPELEKLGKCLLEVEFWTRATKRYIK